MVQVILGNRGSGKTVKLIALTNEAVNEEKGNIFFVDSSNRHMYDLRREVRFVNVSEYGIDSVDAFYGMFSGMMSANFDITLIVVDGLLKMLPADVTPEMLESFFAKLAKLSDEHGVRVVVGISGDVEAMPEFITRYAI